MIPAPPPKGQGCDKIRYVVLEPGLPWYRFCKREHDSALHFGTRADGRWNAPHGEFGILYVAGTADAAFAESIGRDLVNNFAPAQHKILSEKERGEDHAWLVTPTRHLDIAEMNGTGLPPLNLDAGIAAGNDYSISQRWARWIHDCDSGCHGLRYHSRSIPSNLCLALYDRCREELTETELGCLLDWSDPRTGRDIFDILSEQGWGLS